MSSEWVTSLGFACDRMILQWRPVGSCGHTSPLMCECPGDLYIYRPCKPGPVGDLAGAAGAKSGVHFIALQSRLQTQKPLHLSPVGDSHPNPAVALSHHSRMLSFPRVMACSRTCSRFLGLSLGTASLFAAGANIALLFPNWDMTYLTRGLIGKHAMLGSGLWGGGFMMLIALLSSGLALLGALVCFVTSGVALKDGPFCMFDISSFNQTQAWKFGYPFKDLPNSPLIGYFCLFPTPDILAIGARNYLYDRSLWTSVCLEPSEAVVWHVAFFSTLLCISLLQFLLVAIHFINSILGLLCSFCEKS
ncbi:transmembrane 4 L six family member 19 [Cricetulus griseus]